MTGSPFEVVADQMTGPLVYGFSEDAVAAAKVVADFTNQRQVGDSWRRFRRQSSGRERREAVGKHPFQGSSAGPAVLGLLMSPISRTAVVLGASGHQKGEGEPAAA